MNLPFNAVLMTGVLTFVLYNHFQQTVNESIMNVVSAKVTDNMRQLQSLLARIENSTNMVHDNDSLFYEDDAEIPPICKMLISYEEEPQLNVCPYICRPVRQS